MAVLSREGLQEPGTGANAFRRSPTHCHPPGSFVLARGSPIDPGRPSQTSGSCMACRRSGVRIPLAPPLAPPDLFSQLRGLEHCMQPQRRVFVGLQACQPASWFLQVRAVFRGCRDLLRSRSGSSAGPPVTREFPPKLPDGSQTESPSGQNRLGNPTTAPAQFDLRPRPVRLLRRCRAVTAPVAGTGFACIGFRSCCCLAGSRRRRPCCIWPVAGG
jgi:hypothetical protein